MVWHVVGTMAADDPSALIADIKSGSNERLWHIGDHLADDSVLVSISSRSVTTLKQRPEFIVTI